MTANAIEDIANGLTGSSLQLGPADVRKKRGYCLGLGTLAEQRR
jgi:hypothetical protein